MPTFKLGRNRPKAPAPKLRFGNYLLRRMPTAPPTADYSAAPMEFLKNILGNDNNGDCTCAAAFHIAAAFCSNAGLGVPSDLNTANTLTMYYHLTGGQDTGLDEQVVFNYWQSSGLTINGHKISQRVFVDATNRDEVQTALWLFEHLYMVAELPDAWINPFPSGDGFVWNKAGNPDPENGHAFCAFAYDGSGIQKLDSWGLLGTLTYDALAYYCSPPNGGGCYAVLSPEIISAATSKAPNGLNWAQLNVNIANFQT